MADNLLVLQARKTGQTPFSTCTLMSDTSHLQLFLLPRFFNFYNFFLMKQGKLGFMRFLLSCHILHMCYKVQSRDTPAPSIRSNRSCKILMANTFRLATLRRRAYHVVQPLSPSFELTINSFRNNSCVHNYLLN